MCVSSRGRKVERDKWKEERLERDREKKKGWSKIGRKKKVGSKIGRKRKLERDRWAIYGPHMCQPKLLICF